jgi:hypothetical protein
MKAEYIAASEAVWTRNFISELRVVPSASNPMDIYYDNSGAIEQTKEPRSHKKSKHILRRYHPIHKIINQGDVRVCKVHMEHLPQPKHEAHMRSMGIRYLHE